MRTSGFINKDVLPKWTGRSVRELTRRDVRALLDEPGFRKAAGQIRQEIGAMPAPAEVVGVLERLVA
jgi:UDP:flavonoid glycosyltransferase YjiC (YdhE family)